MIYPANYKDFIEQVVLNPNTEHLSPDQITTLFNLHNNYVDLLNPAYNKSCSKCVKEAFQKVKTFFTEQLEN